MTDGEARGATLARLRALCLALPQAHEKETWDNPTFRVRDKIFAMVGPTEGPLSMWCKAAEGTQAHLVAADPERFFAPPYLGPKGWVGMVLENDVNWDEVATLVRRSYALVAPRKLVALKDTERDEPRQSVSTGPAKAATREAGAGVAGSQEAGAQEAETRGTGLPVRGRRAEQRRGGRSSRGKR